MNHFRSDCCIKFLQWLQHELTQSQKKNTEDTDICIIKVPFEFIDVAVFIFSKLAYKILCDNCGLIIPTKLLYEVECLEAFKEEVIRATPRDVKGSLWDAYVDKDAWIAEVLSATQHQFNDILYTISELGREEVSMSFNPKLDIFLDKRAERYKKTNQLTTCLDLFDFIGCFGHEVLYFSACGFPSEYQRYSNFSHSDWKVVLIAKIALEILESFRIHKKRYGRRHGDNTEMFDYEMQSRNASMKIWVQLWELHIEPHLK